MIVKVLLENTALFDSYQTEHGLSLHIERDNKKVLFDTGASGLFLENATALGVDISNVDFAVLSHGHYDHGGGLETFLCENSKAKVYVNNRAFGNYFLLDQDGKRQYLGLDQALLPEERFVFVPEKYVIDETANIFSGIPGEKCLPPSNSMMHTEIDGRIQKDDFSHEQNLIIWEGGKAILFVGCAHRGIINILGHFKTVYGLFPDYVFGGFHLMGSEHLPEESSRMIAEIGDYLLHTGAKYYTGHCTGMHAFDKLKEILGENLTYISTGSEIKL